MGVTVADLRVKFSADTRDAEKSIDSLNSKIKGIGGGATDGIDALSNKLKNVGNDANPSGSGNLFGNLFSNAASVAIGNLLSSAISNTISATISLAKTAIETGIGQIQATVKVGIEFQQDLANIKADLTNLNPSLVSPGGIFDPNTAKQLESTIGRIALDPRLIVGFKDAALSAQTLVRYGYNLQDLDTGMLESAVLLQNATGSTNQLAAETLAKYQAIYRLKPTDANKSVSEITATISAGGFRDLNDYRYALVNMTGAAQAFGVSALDMNTILALTNKQFSSGRTGGTAIRTMFEHLVPSSDKAADAMKALNLTFFNAKGQYVGFEQTLHRLRTAFAGLSQEQSEMYLQAIFGATGSKEVRELLNETTDAMVEQTRATIDNANAVTSAGRRTDTLGAKLSNMGDQLEALRGKFFGDDLQRVFVPAVEALSQRFSNLGPVAERAGKRVADSLRPLSNIITRLISGKGLGNFSENWNSAFGKIKVLKIGDLFSFDIGDIGATFQQGLANFHIDDFLNFSAQGNDSYHIRLSDFITFDNDLAGGFSELKIGDFFHLSTNVDGGKKHININDFVIFDSEEGKRTLEIGQYFKVAQDTIKGTVDLQVGTFKTSIDVASLRTQIETDVGAVGLILIGIPTKIRTAFASFSLSDVSLPDVGKLLKDKIKALLPVDFSLTDISLPDIATQIKDKIKAIIPADFTLSLPTLDSIGSKFSGFAAVLTGLDTSLKGLTADGGGITKVQTLLFGGVKGFSDALASVDENKVASVGISFSGAISSLLGVFTTLSNLGNDNVGKATSAVSSLVQTVLGLATSFTTGLDATKISESASKFTASYVGELTAVLSGADLPGVADAASALLKGITGQFAIAMKGDSMKTVGASLGDLAKTIIDQLSATLSDKTFAQNLGQSFADILAGITKGLSDALNGFADKAGDGQNNLSVAIGAFTKNFITAVGAGLEKAEYGTLATSLVTGITRSIELALENSPLNILGLAGIKPPSHDENLGRAGLQFNNSSGQQNSTISATTVTVNANTATLPPAPVDNSIRVASDFSTALSELNSLKPLKVETTPPLKVETIPPIIAPVIPPLTAPTIPPVQVARPTWLDTMLSWMPPNFGFLGGNMGTPVGNHASGTDFAKGGWSWVGEDGPELIRVPHGAQIMSNAKSMGYVDKIANNAAGNYSAVPALTQQMYTGADWLAITKHLERIDKASSDTAISSKTTAIHALKPPMTDAQRTVARQKAAVAQTGIPANAMMAKTAQSVQKAGEEIAKSFKGTIDELKSALQAVPGLFNTSSVTQGQLDMAKLGIPQNFADDWLRHLTDEVVNGVQWDDADIKDAAARAGIDPSLPAKAILDMVSAQWNDSSLFAGGKNTDLINMDAVKAALDKQQAQASGKDALMALFGIQGDIQQQGVTAGGQLRTGIQQGLTGAGAGGAATPGGGMDISSVLLGGSTITAESVAPLAQSFISAFAGALSGSGKDGKDKDKAGIDFGAAIIGAINTSLTDSTAFQSTGQAILQAITDSWSKSGGTVDIAGGIATALGIQISSKGAIESFLNIGGKIAQILKQGIEDYFQNADIASSVATGVTPPATTPVGQNASGTSYWRGGLTWVGERGRELINLPRGSQVFSNERSLAMAAAGAGSKQGDTYNITIQASLDKPIDREELALDVVSRVKRRMNR